MIAPADRTAFLVALVISFLVLAAGVLGIVLLARRRGEGGRGLGTILGMAACALLALVSGFAFLGIGAALLGNNR